VRAQRAQGRCHGRGRTRRVALSSPGRGRVSRRTGADASLGHAQTSRADRSTAAHGGGAAATRGRRARA
jgi:hypothetical protein